MQNPMNKYQVDIELTNLTYFVEASTKEIALNLATEAAFNWLADYEAEIEKVTATEDNDLIYEEDIDFREGEL